LKVDRAERGPCTEQRCAMKTPVRHDVPAPRCERCRALVGPGSQGMCRGAMCPRPAADRLPIRMRRIVGERARCCQSRGACRSRIPTAGGAPGVGAVPPRGASPLPPQRPQRRNGRGARRPALRRGGCGGFFRGARRGGRGGWAPKRRIERVDAELTFDSRPRLSLNGRRRHFRRSPVAPQRRHSSSYHTGTARGPRSFRSRPQRLTVPQTL